MDLEQLGALRQTSETIASHLQNLARAYLDTLAPILSPASVLGRHAGSGAAVSGEARAYEALKESYRKFSGAPFIVPSEFDEDRLADIGQRLELYPCQYAHSLEGAGGAKEVTITAPLRWYLNYRSEYTPSGLAALIANDATRKGEAVRQFVLHALVIHLVLERNPGVVRLLRDLRFGVTTQTLPELGQLPITVLSSSLPSFRPSDDLIRAATGFSGVAAFIELVDLERLNDLPDPYQAELKRLAS